MPKLATLGAGLFIAFALLPSVGSARRPISHAMTMDQHLTRADFIGRVELNVAEGDTMASFNVDVTERWFSRWPAADDAGTIEFELNSEHRITRFVRQRRDFVVLLSGGAWSESPFTYRENSIFEVTPDGYLRCISGNLLFAATAEGFRCSVQELMAGPPMTVEQLRARMPSLRQRAAGRLGELAGALNRMRRPFRTAPAAAAAGTPERQVVR